jgi:hypothetical protein
MNMASFHRINSDRAAASDHRSNPNKSWPCVACNPCAVCGAMMEPGELISRATAPGPNGKFRHAGCK